MSEKLSFANYIRQNAGELAATKRRILEMYGVYFDRGYNSGGTDPITDPDVVDAGITAADVAAWVTLLEQFGNFFDGSAVTTADYEGTMNRVRSDI